VTYIEFWDIFLFLICMVSLDVGRLNSVDSLKHRMIYMLIKTESFIPSDELLHFSKQNY
jgi:hypothetical protein